MRPYLDACVNIDGYSMIRRDRNRNGGGIIVYVKKNIMFKVREELLDNDLEMLVQIERQKQKPLLVCVWYRPPNSSDCLFDKINNVFDKIETLNLEVIFLGDLNCDVSSKNPNAHTKRLLEFAENYHLTQLIDKPIDHPRLLLIVYLPQILKRLIFVMLYTSDSVITTW